MKLKKALGISEFESPWQKTLLNLEFTHQWLQQSIARMYAEYGISAQQYQTLETVASLENSSPGIAAIKEAIPGKHADTSRMIQRLIQKGLLVKSIRKEDKRAAVISLSALGKQLLNDIHSRQSGVESVLYHLSKKDCKELNQLLDKLRG